jgi:uroporphyrinogen-III decarboxylase
MELEIVPPDINEVLREYRRKASRFAQRARKLGASIPVKEFVGPRIHAPLTALCLIMDPAKVFVEMIENQEQFKQALNKIFKAFVIYNHHHFHSNPHQHFWLSDDYIAFISSNTFISLIAPFYQNFFRNYPDAVFCFHADGPLDHQFASLSSFLRIQRIDIGGFSSLEAACKYFKGRAVISGGLNCKDFYSKRLQEGTIKKAFEAIRLAGSGGGFELAVGGQCYIGINPESLCQFVEVIRREGKNLLGDSATP